MTSAKQAFHGFGATGPMMYALSAANLENGKLGAIFKQYHHVELSPQVLDTGK
jgi:hypothetical protein